MRPARTQMDRFGFPPLSTLSAKLAVALVVGSLLYGVTRGGLGEWLIFRPEFVLGKFALWQVVTYAFIEIQPLSVIFGALMIFMLGGALETVWGRKRFLSFAFGVTAGGALLTLLVALVSRTVAGLAYPGGTVLGGSLWVAYGLWIGKGRSNFWGAPVTGNTLALIGALFVLLTAALAHWALVVPEAFALLLTLAYVKGARPRVLWLKLQAWRLSRQLKSRSKHLRVVGDDQRNMPRDSDRYLH